jgi:hypothetical protein
VKKREVLWLRKLSLIWLLSLTILRGNIAVEKTVVMEMNDTNENNLQNEHKTLNDNEVIDAANKLMDRFDEAFKELAK